MVYTFAEWTPYAVVAGAAAGVALNLALAILANIGYVLSVGFVGENPHIRKIVWTTVLVGAGGGFTAGMIYEILAKAVSLFT